MFSAQCRQTPYSSTSFICEYLKKIHCKLHFRQLRTIPSLVWFQNIVLIVQLSDQWKKKLYIDRLRGSL